MDKKKIIAVFKTHFDIGFTALAREIIAKYSTDMLDAVLNVCEGTAQNEAGKRYVWTMSSWPLLQSLENATPERRARAEQLIRRGQLLAHALPYTTHTEFMGFEELCREFAFSRELCDRYDLPYPISAKMTDVPGHTWFLPSLLAQAGVKFLHLGCNSACSSPEVPLLFWWEGPDGARVLTMYNTTYGSGLLPPRNWKYPVWLALMQTNDNIGPQSKEIVGELEARIADAGVNAELEIATMDRFYEEISRCDLSGLPVVRQDLADSWIHGVGTYPAEVARMRRLRGNMTAAEMYAALTGRADAAVTKNLAAAYEAAELFGEHTWGLDVKTTIGYDRQYIKRAFRDWRKKEAPMRLESSWDEQRSRVSRAESLCGSIADGLAAGNTAAWFNPLGREFDGYAESPCDAENAFDSCGKKYVRLALPAASCAEAKEAVRAADVPIVTDTGETLIAENGNLRLVIGKRDGRFEFSDKKTGKIWMSSCPQYEYHVIGSRRINEFVRTYSSRFYDWAVNDLGRMAYPEDTPDLRFGVRIVRAERAGAGIRVEYAPYGKRSYDDYGNAAKVIAEYTLLGERLHVGLRLVDKQATPYVESGVFCLPLCAKSPRVRINKVGSVVDPAKDIAKGANNSMYCLENWVDLSENGAGVTVVSHDAPLFSLGGDGVYRYRRTYRKPRKAMLCINLFNNSWGTNFPQWTEGDLSYEFDLIPHAGESAARDAAYAAVHAPLFLRRAETFANLLSVEGAELSSVLREDGGWLVRVRETAGKGGSVLLRGAICAQACAAERVDLYGRTLQPLECGESVALDLPANGFATVRLHGTQNK